jgi:MerR family mercuric resistance operon transcriptional regulator
LQERARGKLAEVEAKISDLQVMASTLRAAIGAGCDDLVVCAGQECCPIPFATIAVGVPDAEH